MQENEYPTLFITLAGCLIFLMAFAVLGLVYAQQKRKQTYLSKLQRLCLDHERHLLQTRVEIQEQTFLDISREIHDHINLSLTLAKLNLNTLDWNDRDKASGQVRNSVDILGTAIVHLNDMSRSMNPEVIGSMGLVSALTNEVERIGRLAALDIDLKVTGEPVFLSADKELVVFRIIQEAFNNILKHSGARQVWLCLHYADTLLEIWIRDDGKGFDQEAVRGRKGPSSGLTNMKTRAALFGGQVLVESRRNKGTQLLIKIPLDQ